MAQVDALNLFALNVSVAAAAGTANIGNQIDLAQPNPSGTQNIVSPGDVGIGEAVYLVILANTGPIVASSAGTIAFRLVSDSTASIATDGSATLHWQSKSFVTAVAGSQDIKDGSVIAVIALPQQGGASTYERFLGVQAVIATTTVSAGAVTAYLTFDAPPGSAVIYPDAVN